MGICEEVEVVFRPPRGKPRRHMDLEKGGCDVHGYFESALPGNIDAGLVIRIEEFRKADQSCRIWPCCCWAGLGRFGKLELAVEFVDYNPKAGSLTVSQRRAKICIVLRRQVTAARSDSWWIVYLSMLTDSNCRRWLCKMSLLSAFGSEFDVPASRRRCQR